MLERAAEGIVHGAVAALVVVALFALWRLEEPRQRLGFELLALLLAALGAPALGALAPARAGETFREQTALFATARFHGLTLLGFDVLDAALAALVALGLLLFLRDLLPMLQEPLRRAFLGAAPARDESGALAGELAALASGVGLRRAPALRVVESPDAAIFCSGLARPAVVVSRGLLDRLSPGERRAALAHEAAHLAARDPLLGWLLLGVRSVFCFNPAVQLLTRAVAQELERRADDAAARLTGAPLELAAALVKAHRHARSWLEAGAVPGLDGALAMLESFRARALEARCRRLMAPPARRLRRPGWHLAATGVGLAALLFFVV